MDDPIVSIVEPDVSASVETRPTAVLQTRVAIVQREAIRLSALGWADQRIADALGIGVRTLAKWRTDPKWVEAVERFNSGADETVLSVRERLSLGAMRMLDVMLSIAEDGDAKHADKLSAADSWLDRAGYPRMKAEFGKHEHTIRAEPGFWERLTAVKAETNGDPNMVVDVP